MTVTAIDPDAALLVINLQEGLRGAPVAHSIDNVAACAGDLAATFRRQGLPVILVNTAGGPPGRTEIKGSAETHPADFMEIMAELGPWPGDHMVTKHNWGAFTGTRLQTILREEGVTQVVICGIATSIGVESTARQAYGNGFNVTLASDAMTDVSAEAHENSILRIFPRLGEVGTAREICELLSNLPPP